MAKIIFKTYNCRSCNNEIDTNKSGRCPYCGWHVCDKCGSCRDENCARVTTDSFLNNDNVRNNKKEINTIKNEDIKSMDDVPLEDLEDETDPRRALEDPEWDRALNPDDYDEEGNKIYIPEWWEGSGQEYKDWEDSNDRD